LSSIETSPVLMTIKATSTIYELQKARGLFPPQSGLFPCDFSQGRPAARRFHLRS
jgi:hypothetical protein